jgi:ankyrin repeat protein
VDAARDDGHTPLITASQNGHLEAVRELLARGALPGMVTNDGAIALSAACANGRRAIARLLRVRSALGTK